MKKGEMLGAMITLMIKAHSGQLDKGGNPYFLHPLQVMNLLQTNDEELMCIAVGHDLLEDTSTTITDLVLEGMSVRVLNGIKALTKMPGQSYEDYKISVKSNCDALTVKIADLRHNMDTSRLKNISEKDIERTSKYNQFYLELQMHLEDNY